MATDGSLIGEIKSLHLKETTKEEFLLSAELTDDWFYEVKWIRQNSERLENSSDFIPSIEKPANKNEVAISEVKLENYKRGIDELESVSLSFIIKALNDLGVNTNSGNKFSWEQLNISDRQSKLFKRLIEILTLNKIIISSGDDYEFIRNYEIKNADKNLLDLKYPEIHAELALLFNCGESLSEVLSGKIDPLQLLFPNGDMSLTTELYQNSPGFEYMNNSIHEIIERAVKHLPENRKLKILEIGAGTGSTTANLLPILSQQQTEYTFTDISPVFFTNAKEKFNSYNFIDYRVLNVEENPVSQGFASMGYDIIIASNVIHATQDLTIAAKNILSLLNSNGLLILNEVTEKRNWIDLTFGLTEGWWKFKDFSLRKSYPLLNIDEWKVFLKNQGYEFVKTFSPLNKAENSLTGQSIITARSPDLQLSKISDDHLIIFAEKKTGKNISKYLRSVKQPHTLVIEDDAFEKITDTEFKIDSKSKSDCKAVLSEISKDKSLNARIVLISTHKKSVKNDDVKITTEAFCLRILNLIQSIGDTVFNKTPSLYLVTEDAQFVIENDNVDGLMNSPVWGMAKVISMEHPEMRCKRIDIDSTDDYKYLINEVNSDSDEDQIAFRNGERFVARLKRENSTKNNSLQIDDKASYLITGGFGGLGLLTAKWLAEKGAKHLILTGRSEISESTKLIVKEIESAGVKIEIHRSDVSDKKDLEKVLKHISKGSHPLKGIIHSAGVLDDGVLMNQTKEKFEKVLFPKVLGSWNLHELTKKIKLEFFVMYSSVASMLGSAGQANHSAANAFMDSLAHYRRAKGLAAQSINWGVWSEIGSAAAIGADKQEKISGIGIIDPHQGIQALEKVMMTDKAQIGVVPIDWNKFSEIFRHPFINELTEHSENEDAFFHEKKDFISRIKNSNEEEHIKLLTEYFQNLISGIMGMEPEELEIEIPLNMMGLDSLMAIELKNKVNIELGVDLNLVRYMEETNILQLAIELKEQLPKILNKKTTNEADAKITESNRTDEKTRDLLGNLDNLSEEELEQLLNEMK
ncbi:MAG: SDR family NAD(P)-dependent oxidoreductase, partial [Ignavibacteria bacterium]